LIQKSLNLQKVLIYNPNNIVIIVLPKCS